MASDYLTKQGTSTQCFYETLPFVDGFRWSSKEVVAGLRFKSDLGLFMEHRPTVDDSVEGKLTVRWSTKLRNGAIVLTFNERSMTIRAEGRARDGWYFELVTDQQADLPFDQIAPKRMSCTFKDVPYVVLAKQGTFRKDASSALRIVPQANRIVLDFSTR